MASQGLPVSIGGVAKAYEDFLDVLIVDTLDAEKGKLLGREGLRVHSTNTIMRTAADKANLAREALAHIAAHAGSGR
jgi:2-phospho-L-lactate transferase/gluconeogenesis factor (CofD/UPF0052 family)